MDASDEGRKVVLVTGAGRGIGYATARRFLAEGWRVALLDIERDLVESGVAELASPATTLGIVCDVAYPDQVGAAIATL